MKKPKEEEKEVKPSKQKEKVPAWYFNASSTPWRKGAPKMWRKYDDITC